MSSVETQRLAKLSTSASAEGVADFASAGAAGNRPGNIARDLLRRFLKSTPAPEPYFADVLVRDPRTSENRVRASIPFL